MYMKLKYITILFTLAMVACQNIPEKERLLPIDWENVPHRNHVLLVEFTGYKCQNCPDAAVEAAHLEALCGSDLIVVAMHPATNAFTSTTNAAWDYTCPEADTYYRHLGGTGSTSFPTGVINLSGGFTEYSRWSARILEALQQPSPIDLGLTASLSAEGITADVSLSAAATTQEIRLLLWITESHVKGAQRLQDGSAVTDYEHNHLLRGELLSGDGWGAPVHLEGDTLIHYEALALPAKVANPAACHLIAVALSTNNEVLTVTQIDL